MRLRDKVAIVTGGATGIGRATAALFAREGAAVAIGDVNVDEGQRAAAEIIHEGGRASFHATDVSSSEEVSRLIQAAVEEFGKLDIMHANAGIELCKPLLDTTDEEWARVIDVNLSGVFFACREAVRTMRDQGHGGAIVVTSSPHAFVTAKEIGAYASSKGGIVALMRAFALEAAEYGIRVNALLPGAVDTPMIRREVLLAPDPEAQMARLAAAHPMGRIAEPEEIARVVVFLASDEASFMTGSCVAVDGGMMAALPSGPAISYMPGPR